MTFSPQQRISMRDVCDPWSHAVLPASMMAGPNDFLFQFVEAVEQELSATAWVLGFSVFRDRVAYNEPQMPGKWIGRFESIPVAEGPTHLVHLDLVPGVYLWIAHAWMRGIVARPLEHALPGCFLNCGAIAVRRAARSVRYAQPHHQP